MTSLPNTERILNALQEARTKLEAIEQQRQEQIAIIGMAGRFPGAHSITEFWQNLKAGTASIQHLTDQDLMEAGVEPELWQQPNYVRAYASMDGIDQFDAALFGYSPREATIIDPQHRVFLECAWEALEAAGYNPEQYAGKIAVYGGASLNQYLIHLHSQPQLRQTVDPVQVVVSNVMGLMPMRVSYKLNLTGASCGVQTGCSTSLVAVHLACQSLLQQECDLALAGGVSIGILQKAGYFYHEDGITSPDGMCRTFDAAGKGTVFGNGVGIVVLKRLSQAMRDGDSIQAVIRATAINNDGAQKVGLTAPSVQGQADVIAAALAQAGVLPETIRYIEAHGTGTPIGDPIELAALKRVFASVPQQTCAIGSVKTNVGHLDAAAGVTGLIKTVLALAHRQLPPSLNFSTPNPQTDLANSPFYVNTQLQDWDSQDIPLRAGVSSFGMGGTNAHVVLEAPPQSLQSSPARSSHLLLLSANSAAALEQMTTNLAQHLSQHPDLNLADVTYTLQVGRRSLSHRRMILCSDITAAVTSLHQPETAPTRQSVTSQPAIAFLFPGQGSQCVNMGRELYETESVFRSQIDQMCDLLQPHMDLDLRDLLYPSRNPHSTATVDTSLINQTQYAQLALFVVEYALAQLWQSWGIYPNALIGHSIGEYVAATLANIFSLEDALLLVALRGKLMQQCEPGVMLSVSLAEHQLTPLLQNNLVIAAVNAPELCVVAGRDEAITTLEQVLISKDISHRRLHTSHAFHSPLMAPAADQFAVAVSRVSRRSPDCPILSNVTGTWLTADQAIDPHYWANHLRYPVRFADGIATLHQSPHVLLEVGSGNTLSTFARQYQAQHPHPGCPTLSSLPHPKASTSGWAHILQTLGQLWLAGATINWQQFYVDQFRHRLPLPTYPFEHQRYWVDLQPTPSQTACPASPSEPVSPPHKQPDLANWFYLPTWSRTPLPPRPNPTNPQRWLIVLDSQGVGTAIAEHLTQQHQAIVTVTMGESYQQIDDRTYTLNLSHADDYRQLFHDLQKQGFNPEQILHLGAIEAPPPSELTPTTLNRSQQTRFYSLLYLVQALALTHQSAQLTVITHHTQEVTGDETLNSAHTTLIGLIKVIPQEYPQLGCRLIDISLPSTSQLIHALSRDLLTPPTAAIVAYRHQHRWTQHFTPHPTPHTPHSTPSPIRPNGTYLIAGDLIEGLGTLYAEWLASKGATQLILLGRSDLPIPAEWETWLATHGASHPVSQWIQQMRALQTAGVELLVLPVELTDQTTIATTIQSQPFGDIHGVIHAGVMGDRSSCLISDLNPTTVEAQFAHKVNGLLTLESALQSHRPDFVLLHSSLSAIVGGTGFAAYAGANAFMDALATLRNRTQTLPWISINWDAVKATAPTTASTGSALLDLAISPSEAVQITERVLATGITPQVIVSPLPLQSRIEQALHLTPRLSEASTQFPTDTQTRTLDTPYVVARNEVEQTLVELMQDLLGIEKIGIHDNFFELGGHSLMAIQAVSKIRQQFQVDLPMRQFLFESPTVAGIAKIITDYRSPEPGNAEMLALLEQVEAMNTEEVNTHLALYSKNQEEK